MECVFEKNKKNFGFGCMRLPMIKTEEGKIVDKAEFSKMVDTFMENGFNYFDTAHGYLGRKSELALRECLVERYPRESYVLVDKLSGPYFKTEEEIKPLFEKQLEACGVDYFDFYLMHSQTASEYEHFKKCRAYETAFELKEEGKIKHVGMSFHDSPAVLEKILNDYPDIEVVQLQFNYLDYDDPGIASKACYDVCVKHKKPVIIMEPVKGGRLVKLPDDAQAVFDSLNGGSAASYAIRFTAGFENVIMVLSGMSNMEQMNDNISYMKEFKPLSDKELKAVNEVCRILKEQDVIDCTACRYCVEGCPAKIAIPDLFADFNARKAYRDWNSHFYYEIHTEFAGKASDCIKCGKCEQICPQKLGIRELLVTVAEEFEK